jgi:IS30 family transposase
LDTYNIIYNIKHTSSTFFNDFNTEIGKCIGKDKSVVCREIKRNCDLRSGAYRCDLAQRKYEQRQSYKSKPRKVTEDMEDHIDFYFAHPYHFWERRSNENLNGLIRQYFSKKSDFNMINDQMIRDVQEKTGSIPRKKFKFENPLAVMDKLLFK